MNGITLESAEEAFHLWRAQRSSRVESIPENLWAMALQLHPQHKRSEICKRLRLSGSQLKQRLEGNGSPFAEHGFVLASSNGVKTKPKPSPEVQLTLQGRCREMIWMIMT